MRVFHLGKDGGPESNVIGLFIIEIKSLFSIVLLKFHKGRRESFHTHAFNAVTFWLKGQITEHHHDGTTRRWGPSLKPKFTPRTVFHRYIAEEDVYALTIRGPWHPYWREYNNQTQQYQTLTHGRKVVPANK